MNDPWDDMKRVNPGFGRSRSSRAEVRDILIAMLFLTAAFFMIFHTDGTFSSDSTINTISWIGVALVIVVSGFMLHELAHKAVAQRYGAWAEFRMYFPGLVLALIMSFFGFLFAAPGAVYIEGRITEEQNGKISMAGPIVNLAFGAVAMVAWLMTTGNVSMIFFLFAYINVFLGFFNLLPIPPLDGSKIWKWNPFVYAAMFTGAIAMLALLWLI